MRPTQGRIIIPTHKLTIPVEKITLISLGARTIVPGPISPIIFTIPILKQTFLINRPLLLSKTHQRRKKLSKLKESMEAFLKSQTAFMQNQRQMLNNHAQAISILEVQMSQLNVEQPCTGHINECNVVHTLRSGKKVDNQVNRPKSPVQIDPTPTSTSAILSHCSTNV